MQEALKNTEIYNVKGLNKCQKKSSCSLYLRSSKSATAQKFQGINTLLVYDFIHYPTFTVVLSKENTTFFTLLALVFRDTHCHIVRFHLGQSAMYFLTAGSFVVHGCYKKAKDKCNSIYCTSSFFYTEYTGFTRPTHCFFTLYKYKLIAIFFLQ